MISQYSSGSVDKDAGVSYGGPSGKLFQHFYVPFYPAVTAIEYPDPVLGFCFITL